MVVRLSELHPSDSWLGMRMTAAEYAELPECDERYELVDGVVVMAPAASFEHQDVAGEIAYQIRAFLNRTPIGKAVTDVDVVLRRDLVLRPDVVYLTAAKCRKPMPRVVASPDLVVEVVSPDSRRRDSIAKRGDYEAAGVAEYWLIDPERNEFHFFVMREGKYVVAASANDRFESGVLPGFELDLARIRALF